MIKCPQVNRRRLWPWKWHLSQGWWVTLNDWRPPSSLALKGTTRCSNPSGDHALPHIPETPRANLSLLCLFVLFSPQWFGWFPPLHTPRHPGEGNLLYRVHQLKYQSHLKTSLQAHPEIMFNQGTPCPVKLIHKINHHNTLHLILLLVVLIAFGCLLNC